MRSLIKVVPVLVLIALAIPSSASAQASRTWVSGVGDDANPCSRTAPCKTFAGAISKTAAAGEINCLDPGGFGGVTIVKSMTIKCHYTEGGVLVSGTNAIVVNAATTDKVTLRGLDINGLGNGLNGIRILQARAVRILDSEIYGFTRDGVDFEPANGSAKLGVYRTHIHDVTGVGVLDAPNISGGAGKATLKDNVIEDNGCGIVGAQFGPDPAFNFTQNCGVLGFNAAATATPKVNALRNTIADNTFTAVLSRGSSSIVRVGDNEIVGNALGFSAPDGGKIETWGDNYLGGNGTNGSTTGPATKG